MAGLGRENTLYYDSSRNNSTVEYSGLPEISSSHQVSLSADPAAVWWGLTYCLLHMLWTFGRRSTPSLLHDVLKKTTLTLS
jgi:hypothetical protein